MNVEIKTKANVFEPEDNFPPSSEFEDAKKFDNIFNNLSESQILKVIKIVIDQLLESRKFNLYLSKELLEKEEFFFLASLNFFGGIEKMVKEKTFEEASFIIGETMREQFSGESKYFFEKFSRAKDFGAKDRYDNHLQFTRDMILQLAYNNMLT